MFRLLGSSHDTWVSNDEAHRQLALHDTLRLHDLGKQAAIAHGLRRSPSAVPLGDLILFYGFDGTRGKDMLHEHASLIPKVQRGLILGSSEFEEAIASFARHMGVTAHTADPYGKVALNPCVQRQQAALARRFSGSHLIPRRVTLESGIEHRCGHEALLEKFSDGASLPLSAEQYLAYLAGVKSNLIRTVFNCHGVITLPERKGAETLTLHARSYSFQGDHFAQQIWLSWQFQGDGVAPVIPVAWFS